MVQDTPLLDDLASGQFHSKAGPCPDYHHGVSPRYLQRFWAVPTGLPGEVPCPLSSAASGLWSPKAALTSYWRNDLVQKLHAGSLPDLLDDGPQLLIGLFKVTWGQGTGRGGPKVSQPRSSALEKAN